MSTDRRRLVVELLEFVLHTKKWWLMPVILVLLMIAALLSLSATAAAPFIYSLF